MRYARISFVVPALVLALSFLVAPAAAEEPPPMRGPAGYVENIETPGADGGALGEAAAARAEAERAAETGGEVPGLRRKTAKGVEEIVVQARKRAELLEDTPVSVTALNEDLLREAGVTRLDEIRELVPNLTIRTARSGQDTIVQIRGIGTATGEVVFDPGVGIYVDGVFLPRSLGGLIDVLDVEQIEVLRGPQGTLFGKNTVGGAINVTTIKPREEFEGLAFLRAGNLGRIDTRAMLNLPIIDEQLFGRFAFASTNDQGYTFNTLRDEYWSNRESLSFLGSLRWIPADHVTFDVSGSYSKSHARPKGGQCEFVQNTEILGLYPGYKEECEKSEPFTFQADTHSVFDIESYGLWGTLAYDAGDVGPIDNLEVKSITSWRQQLLRLRNDIDMTGLTVLQLGLMDGGPLDSRPGFQQQISQELQANGSAWDDRITFVGGAFWFWEKSDVAFTTYSQPTIVFPPPLGQPAAIDFLSQTTTDNWNWALYTQVTADLTEWLSLTGGVRYTEEKKGATQLNRNRADPDDISLPKTGSAIYSAWTPMGSLAARLPEDLLDSTPLDHLMTYFTYSRGFRGGGFNGVINPFATALDPFEPEFIDSFEIGAKTIAFDRRYVFNLSLFLGKYDDIQVAALRVRRDPDNPDSTLVERLTQNAAKATTKGVEAELFAVPIDGLQIGGSLGYLDARYDEFPNAVSELSDQLVNRAGQTFNGVPQWQSHIGIQYSMQLPSPGPRWLEGWITPRLDWSYQSEVHFFGEELTRAFQPGYNLLHARLSYDFNDSATQVALWGRNLTDETYAGDASTIANLFGSVAMYSDPPRTYGVELSHRF